MIDLDFNKQKVNEVKLDKDLVLTQYKTIDDQYNIVKLSSGKLMVERRFRNNYDGGQDLVSFLKNFTNSDDLKKYLGVK